MATPPGAEGVEQWAVPPYWGGLRRSPDRSWRGRCAGSAALGRRATRRRRPGVIRPAGDRGAGLDGVGRATASRPAELEMDVRHGSGDRRRRNPARCTPIAMVRTGTVASPFRRRPALVMQAGSAGRHPADVRRRTGLGHGGAAGGWVTSDHRPGDHPDGKGDECPGDHPGSPFGGAATCHGASASVTVAGVGDQRGAAGAAGQGFGHGAGNLGDRAIGRYGDWGGAPNCPTCCLVPLRSIH
jgi:hypothetical protein